MGDDAATRCLIGQRKDRVHGAANLEAPAALKVLGFEEQLRSRKAIEGAAAHERSHMNATGDSPSGAFDVGSGGRVTVQGSGCGCLLMATLDMEHRVFMNPPGIGCSHFNEPGTLTPTLSPAGERGPELFDVSSRP